MGEQAVYKNVIALCKAHGTTISSLEKAVGLSNGTIGKWKRSCPRADTLKLVADYFGTTTDNLLTENPSGDLPEE